MLLGNKNDLKEARVVERRLVDVYAQRHKLPYWEVSAYTGENIEEAFEEFARMLLRNKMAEQVCVCACACVQDSQLSPNVSTVEVPRYTCPSPRPLPTPQSTQSDVDSIALPRSRSDGRTPSTSSGCCSLP